MQKKLTITLDAQVYEGLHRMIGARRISRFIESLVRPHVLDKAFTKPTAKWRAMMNVRLKRTSGWKP